jgi:hypothetical protein
MSDVRSREADVGPRGEHPPYGNRGLTRLFDSFRLLDHHDRIGTARDHSARGNDRRPPRTDLNLRHLSRREQVLRQEQRDGLFFVCSLQVS